MKKLIKNILKLTIVLAIMMLPLVSATPTVAYNPGFKEVSAEYFQSSNSQLLTFEDAQMNPAYQYVDSHNVKFYGQDSTIIRIAPYNRNGASTISADYSINNDANFPQTSHNKALKIVFSQGVYAAGFYAGNAQEEDQRAQVTIIAYDAEGNVLGKFVRNDITNDVTTFIGLASEKPVYSIDLDYGDSPFSEEIDNLMWLPVKAAKVEPRIVQSQGSSESTTKTAGSCPFLLKEGEQKKLSLCTDTKDLICTQYTLFLKGSENGKASVLIENKEYNVQAAEEIIVAGTSKILVEKIEKQDGKSSLRYCVNSQKTTPKMQISGVEKVFQSTQPNTANTVTFEVAVNDYPNHHNSAQTKNIDQAYVVMYILELKENQFKVIDYQIEKTYPAGAKFQVPKNALVDFEGFVSWEGTEKGIVEKKKQQWNAPPPYKNFGIDDQLCQTDFTNILNFLQKSQSYACATSLSVPYKDTTEWTTTNPSAPLPSSVPIDTMGSVCGDVSGSDGYYSVCENNIVKHDSGIGLKVFKATKDTVILEIIGTTKTIKFQQKQETVTFDFQGITYKIESNYLGNSQVSLYITHIGNANSAQRQVLILEREPIQVSQPIETQGAQCGNCLKDNSCLPLGTRVLESGKPLYCGLTKQFEVQKEFGEACQNNFECRSNQCSNEQCIDLSGQLKETKNLLESFSNWLGKLFK